ncbi:hypothetical protein HY491_03885 [Candidatus Woesearchaeota archaeon]|nr:hypothetical protein [Candidatus Woesearchaeota archaeon]
MKQIEHQAAHVPTEIPFVRRLLRYTVFASIIMLVLGWDFLVKEVPGGYYAVTINRLTGDISARMLPGRFFGPMLNVRLWQIKDTFRFDAMAVRYVNGGTATISGSARFELPNDSSLLIALHQAYLTQESFVSRTLRPQTQDALNGSAQLMTSTESYTSQKGQFQALAKDQINNGVFVLEAGSAIDTVGGEEVRRNRITRDSKGNPVRKPNPMREFHVVVDLLTVDDPAYEDRIRDQITSRRKKLMDGVIAKSQGLLAQEETKSVAAKGEAKLVENEYLQKVLNIKEIVSAQLTADTAQISAGARREAARIQREAQEIQGETANLFGQGEAQVKLLMQDADSNLELRLSAFEEGHRIRAEAFGAGKQPVPKIRLGQNGNTSTMLDMLGIQAARGLLSTQPK